MAVGGGGRVVDTATNARARELLGKRLSGFQNSNCWRILSHEKVKVQDIVDGYSQENFYDVRAGSAYANLTGSDIGVPGGSGLTLNQELGSHDAAVIGTLGDTSKTAVLLGTQFFFSGNTDSLRMNSLLHEMLHAAGGLGDGQILQNKYFRESGLIDKGFGDTSGINDWLGRDCK